MLIRNLSPLTAMKGVITTLDCYCLLVVDVSLFML